MTEASTRRLPNGTAAPYYDPAMDCPLKQGGNGTLYKLPPLMEYLRKRNAFPLWFPKVSGAKLPSSIRLFEGL